MNALPDWWKLFWNCMNNEIYRNKRVTNIFETFIDSRKIKTPDPYQEGWFFSLSSQPLSYIMSRWITSKELSVGSSMLKACFSYLLNLYTIVHCLQISKEVFRKIFFEDNYHSSQIYDSKALLICAYKILFRNEKTFIWEPILGLTNN